MIIANKFTTNYDLSTSTSAAIGASIKPSLMFDFAKAKRADIRLTASRSGTATVFDSAGYITNSPANTARVNHDPYTGECLGLLVEEARTNVMRNALSEQGSYVAVDTQEGPNRQNRFRAVPVGSVVAPGVGSWGNQTYAISDLTVGQSRDYTFSGYFSPYGPLQYKPYVVIGSVGTSLTTYYATLIFNANTGSVVSTSLGLGWSQVLAPEVSLHPCGMYYLTWTVRYTQQSTYSSINCYLQILNQSNTQTYTADGASGFGYACLQFEQGYGATSYIPTTTTNSTRSLDLISYPVGDWYNPNEGTLYAEYTSGIKIDYTRVVSIESIPTNSIRILGSDGNGTVGPYFEIYVSNPPPIVGLVSSGTPLSRKNYKTIASYKANDFKFCRDGGTVLTASTGAIPQNLTTLLLGSSGSTPLNGHLAKFAYFPKALTSEELTILTIR